MSETAEDVRRSPAGFLALLQAMRPKQWTKNLFVFAALLFADRFPTGPNQPEKWTALSLACFAFILFCLISSSIYLMNDAADRESDRHHPEKRHRPIASGRLSLPVAVAASLLLGWGGVAAGFVVNVKFGLICLGYYLLQVAYTFALKHIVIIDVFAIAAGFVFRAVAGAFAIAVPNSVWLLVCTLQLALFLGFGKRRHEITSLGESAGSHRRILNDYNLPLIDQFISIVIAGLIVSYALYTVTSPTAVQHKFLVVTLVNVMYGVFRYLYLIHVKHMGGSPETILLKDRPMQVNLLLWLVEVVAAFRFAS
jgi:4-hydroxybenzoate polyprenyltransferase